TSAARVARSQAAPPRPSVRRDRRWVHSPYGQAARWPAPDRRTPRAHYRAAAQDAGCAPAIQAATRVAPFLPATPAHPESAAGARRYSGCSGAWHSPQWVFPPAAEDWNDTPLTT